MVRTGWVTLLLLGASFVALGQQTKASIESIESLIRPQEHDQALEMSKLAFHQTPNAFRLWTLRGIILSIKGGNHDAIDAFQKALSLSPNYQIGRAHV